MSVLDSFTAVKYSCTNCLKQTNICSYSSGFQKLECISRANNIKMSAGLGPSRGSGENLILSNSSLYCWSPPFLGSWPFFHLQSQRCSIFRSRCCLSLQQVQNRCGYLSPTCMVLAHLKVSWLVTLFYFYTNSPLLYKYHIQRHWG